MLQDAKAPKVFLHGHSAPHKPARLSIAQTSARPFNHGRIDDGRPKMLAVPIMQSNVYAGLECQQFRKQRSS
jgi:hypothetical protein